MMLLSKKITTGFKAGFLLITLCLVACTTANCPGNEMSSIGACSFRIHCTNSISGVQLPDHCQAPFPFTEVDLTLSQANDTFEINIDDKILQSITTFRSASTFPQSSLTFLTQMPNLKRLFLIGNQIEFIKDEPFYNLDRLETLDLSYNSLSDIEDLFQFEKHPNSLKKLFLSHNVIEEIPSDTFEELTSLKELDISFNMVSDLSEEPFLNLTNLEILRLNNNRITLLNGALNNLVNLKHLYLRGNQIQSIDEPSLKIVYQLETLDMSSNQLFKLKPNLLTRNWQKFGGIFRIILSDNQITFLANGTVEELMSRFTRDLSTAKRTVNVYTKLDLSRNSIRSVEYEAFMPVIRLISLNLSFNKLTKFMVNPKDLVHIKFLNLSHNQMNVLHYESFSKITDLQEIDLSFNRFGYVPYKIFMNNNNVLNRYVYLKSQTQIRMFVEGNNFSCDLLGKALQFFDEGYSKVLPTVHKVKVIPYETSIKGIPCDNNAKRVEELVSLRSRRFLADERLLSTNRQILEAMKEQIYYLRRFMNILTVKH